MSLILYYARLLPSFAAKKAQNVQITVELWYHLGRYWKADGGSWGRKIGLPQRNLSFTLQWWGMTSCPIYVFIVKAISKLNGQGKEDLILLVACITPGFTYLMVSMAARFRLRELISQIALRLSFSWPIHHTLCYDLYLYLSVSVFKHVCTSAVAVACPY